MRQRLSHGDALAAAQAYSDGCTVKQIRHEFGLSNGVLYGILLALGVPLRGQSPRRTDPDQRIASLYESGEKVAAIAAEIRCSPETVRRAARRAGLSPRRRA